MFSIITQENTQTHTQTHTHARGEGEEHNLTAAAKWCNNALAILPPPPLRASPKK